MILIPDDPIISCAMRTGYPPWFFDRSDDEEEPEDEEWYLAESREKEVER